MRFIKELLEYFAYITAGSTMAFAVYTMVTKVESVPIIMIAEIPVVGFIIALITTVMLYKEPTTKKGFILVAVLHFVFVSAAMVVLGVLFKWIAFDFKQILLMLICVVFVWLFTFLLSYFSSKREAGKLNDALNNLKK